MKIYVNLPGMIVELGSPPATHVACDFCGGAAQLLVDGDSETITACASCAAEAIATGLYITEFDRETGE
jgi:hypothetical protein